MIAVIYMPLADDAGSGPIVQTVQGSASTIAATAAAMGGAAVEVTELRVDHDSTSRVQDGKVVSR